jgi:hypothetical protein
LGETKPDGGKRFLVLDLTWVDKVDQGIKFQTGEQLKLLILYYRGFNREEKHPLSMP